MRKIKQERRFTALLVLIGLSACSAIAQQIAVTQHPYAPEEFIKLDVSFSGPGAPEIRTATMSIFLQTQGVARQDGFESQVRGGSPKPISTTSFELSLQIPKRVVTGNYKLVIHAYPRIGGQVDYESGKDFSCRFGSRIHSTLRRQRLA
jgi:hypothetical protein